MKEIIKFDPEMKALYDQEMSLQRAREEQKQQEMQRQEEEKK